MSKRKPIIGVTGPARGGTAAWVFTKLAVWRNGGRAVRLTPETWHKSIQFDGLILGGGADISPERYGQKRRAGDAKNRFQSPRNWGIIRRTLSIFLYPVLFLVRKFFSVRESSINPERDEMEFTLLEQALKENKPVLGICRGSQLINIKMGGNLHQDLTGFYGEIPKIHSVRPRKKIHVDKSSRLHEMVRNTELWVNALHFQAVDEPGEKMKVVAREESGVIQAVESRELPFIIGVQWHPEYMPQVKAQNRIFQELVRVSRKFVTS